MRTCWRCQGDGSVAVPGYSLNPYSGTRVVDPQEETSERCDICHGTGEIEDGVTREELAQYIEGEVLDVTMIAPDHPMAEMCAHPGKVFRIVFERTSADFDPATARLVEPGRMRPITSTIVWGRPAEDAPDTEAYYVPVRDDARFMDGTPDDLRFGLHTHLIKDIERING